MGVHAFRFGVLAKAPRPGSAWTELARRVEALGYSTLLVPDHSRPQLAPFPALLAAAGATSTLRVGTLVANNDFRHPTVTAREALTVDLLSGGRLELGLGAGWMRRDYEEAGIQWDRGRARADRLAEAVEIIRLMEAERPFDFAGSWYRLAQMHGGPAPIQRPLPLLIGAGGPRMLALAAGSAGIVSFGRSMAAGPTAADAAAVRSCPQHLLVADPARAVAALRERRDALGISYFAVNELALEAFAPVVSALSGT